MSKQEAGAAATAASAAPTPCVPRPLPLPSPPALSLLPPPSSLFGPSDPAIARVCSLLFLAFSLRLPSFIHSVLSHFPTLHLPFSFFYRFFFPLPLFCIFLPCNLSHLSPSHLFLPLPLFSSWIRVASASILSRSSGSGSQPGSKGTRNISKLLRTETQKRQEK